MLDQGEISNMTRSVWKGPFYEPYLLKKADETRKSGKTNTVIKIWTRKSTILPEFVGLTFGVYNGKKFIPVSVNESMVGHKFGEFSPTRTFNSHSAERKTETTSTGKVVAPGAATPTTAPPKTESTDDKKPETKTNTEEKK